MCSEMHHHCHLRDEEESQVDPRHRPVCHMVACEEAGNGASRNTVPRKGHKASRNKAALAAALMVTVFVL